MQVQRFEKKYYISPFQYDNLKLCLSGICEVDRGGK